MVYAGPSAATPDAHYDSQREREFYRYYDPIRALSASGPRWTNLYDEAAARQHRPSSCPDLSLTAFCQLGALRLGARRCMLFFFDRTNAYVMAEATRTLSLHDHDVHESGDGLWLGFTIIPRGLSVCEHTVNMPPGGDDKPVEEIGDTNLLHIIEDMRGSERFCDRPYVIDGPKARFYAGVPIITPSGLRIGAYCILDDKAREGLNESDVKFMLEMGKTVMAHLETVRERAEFGRGTRMLKGLRSFVQEASSRRSEDPATGSLVRFSQDEDQYSSDNRNRSGSDGLAQQFQDQITLTKATPPTSSLPFSKEPSSPGSPLASTKSTTNAGPTPESGLLGMSIGSDVNSVFKNAANLVRDAMDAEGCLFLDVVSNAQKVASGKYLHRRTLSEHSGAATDTGSENGDALPQGVNPSGSNILGQSYRSCAEHDNIAGVVPATTLQRLLRKYPRGKIWNFNSDGDILSSDRLTDTHVKQPSALAVGDTRRRKKHRHTTADDAAELRAIFPEVRSLCLVGLWDLKGQRWRAGALVWSLSPVRVFSVKGELGFVVAFGEVIMAEVAALEAKREEKKRSDFVSSISHELRSPLHGILGSLDMLNQDHPTLQHSTDVKQIESCTLTMLDLVEHLLSYAEYQRRSKQRRQTIEGLTQADSDESQPERPLSLDLSPGISIAKATEEIAGVLMHSHQCDSSHAGGERTDMALDIALGPKYIIRGGVGEWKRLCSIVIGNALKFTDKGHVSVSLRLSKKRKRSLAILTISDTGCGMSQDFIHDGLFRAFQQEDGLRTGMGLGMTLASKIVRTLGGRIQVNSEQNQGTTFRITVPVETNMPNSETPDAAYTLRDLKINVTDFVALGTSIRPEVVETLKQTYERLEAQLVPAAEAQAIVLFDDELDNLRAQQDFNTPLLTKPLLVLCRDTKAIQKFRDAKRILPNPYVEYIPQPYGPKRLADAVRLCAKHENAPIKTRSNSTTYQIERRTSQIDIDTLNPAFAKMHIPATEPVAIGPQSPQKYTEPGAQQQPDQAPQIASIKQESITITATSIERPETTPAVPAPPVPVTPAPSSTELCLLLVDDNPVNLRLLTTYASKKSHPHLTATNGKEAVDAYSNAVMHPDSTSPKPDAILLDINMPVMDGFEAARCIRNLECLYNVPAAKIIALTGLGSEQARREAMQSGIDMFLTKPVRLKELAGILGGVKKRAA
ncbi:hypothetical protein BDZ85DRAFT_270018 [Elsinoe ampelina]|uniref:Uncharacterized protein n=1 Tax=Elsinoe ampelina TaxID=302913 RepID=A0A6A6FZ58_9PEZI|nr:hypothetical protein BDZ85DRAFT_270018 [Elsinoe ampelina]